MTHERRTDDSDAELPINTASAAEQAGSLLDASDAAFEDASLSPDERRNLADQFWLSSLLTQMLHPAEAARRETLVQSVMNSIQQQTADDSRLTLPAADIQPPLKRRSWIATAASLAAVLLVGFYLFAPEAGPQRALAAVERSIQAAAEDVDRQYQILMSRPDGAAKLPILLTVRGAKNFVWEQPVPHGKIQVGSNGKDFWMVPVLGPVMVATEGSRLERLLSSQRQSSTPILNLSTALEWLRDHYDLEILPPEQVPESETSTAAISCVHYRGSSATRSDLFLPGTMEIWSHPETGVVQRAIMTWPALLQSGELRADLRLKASPPEVPAEWYEHAAHHDEHRMVIYPPKGFFPMADEPDANAP